MRADLYVPDLGNIWLPALHKAISLPGTPTRRTSDGEFGVFVARQYRGGKLVWHSITHNDRVNSGGSLTANRMFGQSAIAAVGVMTALAIASTNFTKTATDLSIGSITTGVTTNEFTTGGLARVTGTLGTWTAQSALNGQFTQLLTNTFSSTATQTAYGAATLDSTTPSGSHLFAEDLFAASASLASGDSLALTYTCQN